MQVLGEHRSPEVVCDRLHTHIATLRSGDVDPIVLSLKNRITKRLDEYYQTTRNVGALERAADLDLDINPGQDIEYIVVNGDLSVRAQLCLLH